MQRPIQPVTLSMIKKRLEKPDYTKKVLITPSRTYETLSGLPNHKPSQAPLP